MCNELGMWNALSQVHWTTLRLKFMSTATDAMMNCLYLLTGDEVDKVGFSKIVHHIEYEYTS